MRCDILKKLVLLLSMLLVSTASRAYAQDYTLVWDPNPEQDVIGYKLFYKAGASIVSAGSYDAVIDVGNSTLYTVTGLQDGTVYYFAIKAYDVIGAESPYSEEVCTVDGPIPTPEPEPEPDPVLDPDYDVIIITDPDPVLDPEPDPTTDPEPDPTTDPEPDPIVLDPEPDPIVLDPEPDPTTDPEPDPIVLDPEPDPATDPEPDPIVLDPEPATPPDFQGDVNRDGRVDAVDLVAVVQAFGTAGTDTDLNGDGVVDNADLDLVISSYGSVSLVDGSITHVITASAGPGGTIFPESAVQVADGAGRSFLISPESGYIIEEVLVDGSPVILEDGAYGYRFEDVMSDHTIEVQFASTPEHVDELALRLEFNGDFQDASGWENHGSTLAADMPVFTLDRFGRPGKACQFDGVSDFVRVESSAAFRLPEYTLSAWVYGMRDYDYRIPQYILSTNRKDTDNTPGMFAFSNSLCASGTGIPHTQGEVLDGKENTWTHLTIVRNVWTFQFYLDGQYVGEVQSQYNRVVNPVDLIIGARTKGDPVPAYGFFNGILDDVRIYNRPLSAGEIQNMVAFPGDVDRDGDVDGADLLSVANAFGSIEGDANWNSSADFDWNGQIDMADLVWAAWGFDAGREDAQSETAQTVESESEEGIATELQKIVIVEDSQESTDIAIESTHPPREKTR